MSGEEAAAKKTDSPPADAKPEAAKPAEPMTSPRLAAEKTHLLRELALDRPLLACRFDPAGKYVFGASQDFAVYRWELAEGTKAALKGHSSWVRALAFLPGTETLVSGGYDGQLIWWKVDEPQPKPLRTIDDAHQGWIRAVAVSPDGKMLASCGNDQVVKLWTADGEPLRTLEGHTRHVYNVAFHPQGQGLASFDLMGKIRHWDPATGALVRELDAGVLHKYDETFRADIGGARSLAFTPDGQALLCGGITGVTNAFAGIGNAAVAVMNWETGKQDKLLTPKANVRGTMWGLVVHPDGMIVGACGGGGGNLFFWKPGEAKTFHELKLPGDAYDLALAPDGLTLAVAHFDNKLRLYSMTEKAPSADKPAPDKAAKPAAG